ncbi:winged helix-turn-helix domain-containing protein [Pantoea ananatis]|uniref:winged helix-turn-helix domain-containing protein n=1 Tax=Pantoea ananas TaxID=553 RepID=UPI003BFA6DEE
MSRKITLNNFLIFEPDKKRITGRGRTAVISASASLCLELLIENAGHLVTHQQFYDYVWRRFGTEPTSASLYHNISSLRRALSKAGLHEDIIRTMPRKGFILSPQTTINKAPSLHSHSVSNKAESADVISAGGNETSDTSTTEGGIQAAQNERKVDTEDIPGLHSPLTKPRFFSAGFSSKKFIALTSFFAFTTLFLYFFDTITRLGSNDGLFIYSTNYKGCIIFNNSDSWLSQSEVKQQVDELNIVCQSTPYVYLTAYKHADSLSYFNCEHPLDGSVRANCRSHYYVKNLSND